MILGLYARVSTKLQERKQTIASQVAALREFARTRGDTVAEESVFLDDGGVSGATLARRGLDRLRDAAEAGHFDAVAVLSPDRLSRKYAYLILVLEEFGAAWGARTLLWRRLPATIRILFCWTQIQGAVAEYERAKLAERYRRGKLHRANQGEVFWTTVPYGYRRVARCDGTPAHLVIDADRRRRGEIHISVACRRYSQYSANFQEVDARGRGAAERGACLGRKYDSQDPPQRSLHRDTLLQSVGGGFGFPGGHGPNSDDQWDKESEPCQGGLR